MKTEPRYRVELWDIVEGERLSRRRVHDRFGGNRQNGISPSRKSPNILLFSHRVASARYGFHDDLDSDPVIYCGEGQTGDQRITRGNRAILDYQKDGRALRLFKMLSDQVQYLGQFELDPDQPLAWEEASQASSSTLRKVAVFRLRRC
ncbi:MAG: hypothetical protein QOG21_2133 [Actinomycetota bacterium]|jgi:hypothetical protein|nr:hypothetical protein [Actinomycetota bacterium]